MTELNGEVLDRLVDYFPGKIVRKDLTKRIKEGANVPVYVLEYLLGMYCSSLDEDIVEAGVDSVKKILANNYVRPDEAEKVKSKLRERGSYTVIDKISVKLDYNRDVYVAEFSNLGLSSIPLDDLYPSKYERLLSGGIWCIVQMEYFFDENDRGSVPFIINRLDPVQMPAIDMEGFKKARKHFTDEEWLDILMRSIGMEPTKLSYREKWLHLLRLVPLVENNYNFCELGPRSTGKSHVYKEISPNSILVSGGQTTVANLFYNMSTKKVGLVGSWDCVAFDEVAGITFKDNDGIQIMKDYMASGSFARGKEEKAAMASFAFVGNINESVDVLLKTSSLFDPFPEAMSLDTAFLDRMHCYSPGWEISKYRPDYFTDGYGFITDYFAEVMKELRKETFGDAYRRYFRLGSQLNQRDTIAVNKTVSGLVKLMYPDGVFEKEEVEEVLSLALEMRRRVKEQLKRIGGMEFFDVNFSYIDNESFEEHYVTVPEQSGSKLIPEGIGKPGHVYYVSLGESGMGGAYKLETQVSPGSGKFSRTGIGSNSRAKESVDLAFNYLKANAKNISGQISTTSKDYLVHVQDLNGVGMSETLTLATIIAIASAAISKPVLPSLVVLGDATIGGTVNRISDLANILQVCLDSGAKKILLPLASASDLQVVPPELMGAFNLIFYTSIDDAVFKALGVE